MESKTEYAATLTDIREAAERIAPYAHRTPIATCAAIDRRAGREVVFKCEQYQKVGAFKFRGACNAVMRLSDEAAVRGVATHSSGNHAQALALAAKLRGVDAHVVMPSNAKSVKRRAVEGYGARIIECEPTLAARESTVLEVLADTGATLVPPYDHPDIIAGQGTAALELLEQVPDLDAIVAPVGGGGLVSGTALTAHGVRPSVRIFAAEPKGADDAARSKTAGELILQTGPRTIADGLLTSLGEFTWPVVRDLVERVVTVEEEEIVAAMRLAWERAKLLIEPSSATALAAVLTEEFLGLDEMSRVGVILSGGNVDLEDLPW
jgi:threonine dehydratase/serine racemase